MFGLVPWSAGTVKNVLEGLGRREKKMGEGGTEIRNMTLTSPSLHLSLNPRIRIKRRVWQENPSTLCQDGLRSHDQLTPIS